MNQRLLLSKSVVPLLAVVALFVGATPLLFIACSNGGGSSPTAPEAPVNAVALSADAQGNGNDNPRNNDAVCDGYDHKDDYERQKYTLSAPFGQTITELCMKAGQSQFIWDCTDGDISNDCHVVTWSSNCSQVMLERLGSGRNCQGMSHAAIDWEPGPTPTPSPSATPPPI